MKKPIQCALWEKPELVTTKDYFEIVEVFEDESHLIRRLLKCRECNQLYFYEFYETIDWENGNDPQYRSYIPVETKDEIETLKNASVFDLMKFSPRLQRDFPKDAETPTTQWVGK